MSFLWSSYSCRKGKDFVSCLTYAVVLEGCCLLEPLVGSFAVLHHVVVESKFLLCSLVCSLHDFVELIDFVAWLDCICDSCKDLSILTDCCCCKLNIHLDKSVLSVSWSCAVLSCRNTLYAKIDCRLCLKFLCIWVCCCLHHCFDEVWYADGAGSEECLVCCDDVAWMWLILSPYPCRHCCHFFSCLSDYVFCECVGLLEPFVCSFAELDHVVVISKLILALECLLRVDCVSVHLVLGAVDLCVHDDAVLIHYNCSHCC